MGETTHGVADIDRLYTGKIKIPRCEMIGPKVPDGKQVTVR